MTQPRPPGSLEEQIAQDTNANKVTLRGIKNDTAGILKNTNQQVQKGITDSYDTVLTVLNHVVRIPLKPYVYSVTFINDGPGAVQFQSNFPEGSWNTLYVGESMGVDVDEPTIYQLGVRLLSGASASLRIPTLR